MRNLRLRYSAELCDTEVVDNACEQLGLPAPGRGRHPQAEGGTLLYGNYHGNYTGVEMKGSEISKEEGIITVPNESPANAVHHVAQAHKA